MIKSTGKARKVAAPKTFKVVGEKVSIPAKVSKSQPKAPEYYTLAYDLILSAIDDILNLEYETKFTTAHNKEGELVIYQSHTCREGRRKFNMDYPLKQFFNILVGDFIENLSYYEKEINEIEWANNALKIMDFTHLPVNRNVFTSLAIPRKNLINTIIGSCSHNHISLIEKFCDIVVSMCVYLAPLTTKIATLTTSEVVRYFMMIGFNPHDLKGIMEKVESNYENYKNELASKPKKPRAVKGDSNRVKNQEPQIATDDLDGQLTNVQDLANLISGDGNGDSEDEIDYTRDVDSD